MQLMVFAHAPCPCTWCLPHSMLGHGATLACCLACPCLLACMQEVEQRVARLKGLLDADISRGLERLPIPLINEVDGDRVRCVLRVRPASAPLCCVCGQL